MLEKQADKTMSYGDLRNVFEKENKITYFLAIGNLKRGKRMKMLTEDGVVKYELI